MNIEHLVISGGGPVFGLYVYGILNHLCNDSTIDITKIKTIHGSSAGSIIGAILCLNYDWDDLTDYIVGKPWDRIVNIEPQDILNVSNEKGILERKFFEEIFSTLLLAKDLNINATLKDIYNLSGIDLHIYTTKVNTFEYINLSHLTHPDIKIIDAVNMSSAIPFIFKPVKLDNDFFIDGGVIRNFPLETFLENNPGVLNENILGITIHSNDNNIDCDSMSLLEYASFIYRNQLILIDKYNYNLIYKIKIILDSSEVFKFFSIFKNSSMREEIIKQKSKKFTNEFLETIKLIRSNNS